MATSEEVGQLQEQCGSAQRRLAELDEPEREQFALQLESAEAVLGYTALVLQSADPQLVSANVRTNISNALAPFANDPTMALASIDSHASAVLDAIALLPTAKGRDVEQVAKNAAANFQRAAQQRLNALEQDLDDVRDALENTSTQVETRAEQVEAKFQEQASALTTKLSELDTTIATRLAELQSTITAEQTRITDAATAQASTYEEAEGTRNKAVEDLATQTKERFDAVETESRGRVDALIDDIQRMQKESAELVGAIGLAGTAERYSQEVKQQREVADRWRLVTVGLALAAVAFGVFAVFNPGNDWHDTGSKLAVSVILGGLAAYTARQSAAHRHREQGARDLELELTAFSPFIEPLSDEQKEEERVVMTRKTFGKSKATEPTADEEPGPTALSAMLRRRNQS